MADIDAGAPGPETKRYTVWSVLAMLAASAVAILLGIVGYGLWVPGMMTIGGADAAGQDMTPGFIAVIVLMMGGPAFALLGLVAGWIAFAGFRAPWTGVKLAFYLPVVWIVSLLAWMAFTMVAPACDGSLTCGF